LRLLGIYRERLLRDMIMLLIPSALGRACALLGLLALPASAWAMPPDPLDAAAPAPALSYQSPLEHYQGWREQPIASWREANELVGRIGGWRTYAQEPYSEPPAAEPKAAQPKAPAAPAMAPMEHQHHGHH
jgi:hypothetical protein